MATNRYLGRVLAMSLPLLSIGLSLGGCGFTPLYAPAIDAHAAQFAQVFVSVIADRPGQELRQALQMRLDDGSASANKTLVLDVRYTVVNQGLSVQADNSTTRNRITGAASWSLHSVTNPQTTVFKGQVRAVDGYNVLNGQFFYADLSAQAAEKRLAEALADQIAARLAVYFKTYPVPA